ncbi:MAG: hypothetical protein HBSAPP03_22300 [Phycisphaerae bacterium]|nr:MAG: hypothetical protein HBSAPP03_22300 [Phycisphaerae bacterium]
MTEHTNKPDPAERAPVEPYELDAPPPRPPAPPPTVPGKEGLLDDFDEDADFERDPEVERALRPGSERGADQPAVGDEPPRPREEIVTLGRGEPEIVGGVGGLVAVAAMVVGAVRAEGSPLAAALYTGLVIVLYVGAGLGAIAATAHLQGMTAGRWVLAGARMLLVSAAFQFLVGLRLAMLGWVNGFVFPLLAMAVYAVLLAWLFRLARPRLFILAMSHAAFALAVRGGLALYAALAGSVSA